MVRILVYGRHVLYNLVNPDLWLRVMTSSQSNDTDTNLGPAVAFRPPAQRTSVCFDYNNKE